jgi:adenine-specific DNA methylase
MITEAKAAGTHVATPLAQASCFIERQFPVAKISMESYKERKANYSQTITGLGKWWGRKPLILVRATILGLLMPVSDDPAKDRDIFLRLLTMDTEGLRRRKTKAIGGPRLLEDLAGMPPSVRDRFLEPSAPAGMPKLRGDLSRQDKAELQLLVFDRLSYSEKLEYCDRPEQIEGPSSEAWNEINAHLGASATTLSELVEELGRRRFGHRPRVGDSFCGGGSIPFEAARIGCDVYGSDLNPVAALLTWAALNLIGGGEELARKVEKTQQEIFKAVDRQITEWGIEHNEREWRADAYLYCVEVTDPESGWKVPLMPSLVIGEKTRTAAKLVPDRKNKRYKIEIHEAVSDAEMKAAKEGGTVKGSRLVPPHGGPSTPIQVIRGDGRGGLRLWESEDLVPRPNDAFQERLYCIRWVETYIDDEGKERTRRHYRAPTEADLRREERVLDLLRERFADWQAKGYIPSRKIEPGAKTDEPIRTRGWTHWHHLFTPRQLLVHGLFQEICAALSLTKEERVAVALGIARCADWDSKLCRWDSSAANEKVAQTFSNQALNTLYTYAGKGVSALASSWFLKLQSSAVADSIVEPEDARRVNRTMDLWVTDPPYADAINYHELSEYLLGWYEKQVPLYFPNWYADSKRALAVSGSDSTFKESMMECYRSLARHMPDDGLQVVMFTHQDAAVWADLTMILWAAGLRVTAAWCIATETDSALKQGNYVQGTVLLVLRKRTEEAPVFLDEITYRVEAEVKRQLDSMLALEDDSDPNFGDADHQLAAYAAALRVLTERPIEEIDPAKELLRERPKGSVGPVEQLIRNAVKIACDHLVPRGLDPDLWKALSPMERFYLKGLEVESHAEHRSGVYQELARGFGAANYDELLASTRANETRLKSASEFGRKMLSGDGFGGSLARQALFAVHQTAKSAETREGMNWLRTELPDYWASREKLVQILDYLAAITRAAPMAHWKGDSAAAALLCGAVRNDHV